MLRCKRAGFASFLAIALTMVACGGCIIGATPTSSDNTATTSSQPAPPQSAGVAENPKSPQTSRHAIQEDLQKQLESMLSDDSNLVEAFALVSEGGFSGLGNGQHIILVAANGSKTIWSTNGAERPAGREAFKPTSTDTAKMSKLGEGLKDYKATAFDAISYVYIHWKRPTGGALERKANVLISNLLSGKPEASPYLELIAAFKASAPK